MRRDARAAWRRDSAVNWGEKSGEAGEGQAGSTRTRGRETRGLGRTSLRRNLGVKRAVIPVEERGENDQARPVEVLIADSGGKKWCFQGPAEALKASQAVSHGPWRRSLLQGLGVSAGLGV